MIADALSRQVDDTSLGIGFLLISIIFLIWGLALVVAAYRATAKSRLAYPRWHHRRFMAYAFDFWLGWTFLLVITGIYGYLGFAILSDDHGIGVGWVLYFVAAVVCCLAAMRRWARDRIPEVLP